MESFGRREGISVCGLGLMVLLLAVWAAVSGCPSPPPPVAPGPVADSAAADQSIMRVRIAEDVARVSVAVDGPWRILDDHGRVAAGSSSPLPLGDVTLESGPAWRLGPYRIPGRKLELLPGSPGTLRVGGVRYDGFLRLAAWGTDQLVAINVVHLEDYVAAVVIGEMPASFGAEALKAQAIIARTYGLYEKSCRQGGAWDLSDGPEAQVYKGVAGAEAAGGVGRRVARDTAGLVLTFGPPGQERIFGTFYHSTCGGSTVSIRFVKPRVGEIPPLAGGVRCPWCAASKYSNWSAGRIAKAAFWPKLLRAYPAIASLGAGPADVRIEPAAVSELGRVTQVRLIGPGGQMTMLADEFRLIVGSTVMRSTLVRLADAGDAIELTDGHGWGHGVGLCQVGAAGLARTGHKAEQILTFYYPGAAIRRLP